MFKKTYTIRWSLDTNAKLQQENQLRLSFGSLVQFSFLFSWFLVVYNHIKRGLSLFLMMYFCVVII